MRAPLLALTTACVAAGSRSRLALPGRPAGAAAAALATATAPPGSHALRVACATSDGAQFLPVTVGGEDEWEEGGGNDGWGDEAPRVVQVGPLLAGQGIACRVRLVVAIGVGGGRPVSLHEAARPPARARRRHPCALSAAASAAGTSVACPHGVILTTVAAPRGRRNATGRPPPAAQSLVRGARARAAAADTDADANWPLPGQYALAGVAAAVAGVALGALVGLAAARAAELISYRRYGGRLSRHQSLAWMQLRRRRGAGDEIAE